MLKYDVDNHPFQHYFQHPLDHGLRFYALLVLRHRQLLLRRCCLLIMTLVQ